MDFNASDVGCLHPVHLVLQFCYMSMSPKCLLIYVFASARSGLVYFDILPVIVYYTKVGNACAVGVVHLWAGLY